jgi:hypothetical protein
MTVSSNSVTGSSQGIGQFSSGKVFTLQNNAVRGNITDIVNGPFTSFGGT